MKQSELSEGRYRNKNVWTGRKNERRNAGSAEGGLALVPVLVPDQGTSDVQGLVPKNALGHVPGIAVAGPDHAPETDAVVPVLETEIAAEDPGPVIDVDVLVPVSIEALAHVVPDPATADALRGTRTRRSEDVPDRIPVRGSHAPNQRRWSHHRDQKRPRRRNLFGIGNSSRILQLKEFLYQTRLALKLHLKMG